MSLTLLTPSQSLNKAYRKEKVGRAEIELFKKNLKEFITSIDRKESEEHVKNNVTKFLYDTYYNGKNQINTKGRIDLAIYEDKKPVVIIEAKRPSSSDMVTVKNLNAKAMQELILYYLRERIDEGNIDIKYLVATNMHEWFVFDANVFDKIFYKNNALTKDYVDWKGKRKANDTTDFFYSDIAAPFLKNLKEEIILYLRNNVYVYIFASVRTVFLTVCNILASARDYKHFISKVCTRKMRTFITSD